MTFVNKCLTYKMENQAVFKQIDSIDLFHKYLPRIYYYVPGTVLSIWDTTTNKYAIN